MAFCMVWPTGWHMSLLEAALTNLKVLLVITVAILIAIKKLDNAT